MNDSETNSPLNIKTHESDPQNEIYLTQRFTVKKESKLIKPYLCSYELIFNES